MIVPGVGAATPSLEENQTGVEIPELAGMSPQERAAFLEGQRFVATHVLLSNYSAYTADDYDPATRTLVVYWKTGATLYGPEVERQAAADEISLELRHVDFTEAELVGQAKHLGAAASRAGIVFSTVAPNESFSSIDVSGRELNPGVDDTKVQELADEAGLTATVTVVPYDPENDRSVQYDYRRDDENPFDVAGAIRPQTTSDFNSCSTGMPLKWTGNGYWLVTAAHCAGFANYQRFYNGASSTSPGRSRYVPTLWGNLDNNYPAPSGAQLDAALVEIDYAGGTATSNMFIDDQYSTAKRKLYGRATIPYSGSLCVSGAATGSRCNFHRTSAETLVCQSQVACRQAAWVVGVTENAGNTAVMFGAGDSGGPIYIIDASEHRYVVGFVQGARPQDSAPCGSWNIYPEAYCSFHKGRVTAQSSVISALPDDFDFVT